MNALSPGRLDEALASAMQSAAEATREALTRLFSREVLLTKTLPPADPPFDPSPVVQVAFDVNGPVDAKVIVSAEGPDAAQLADALLRRRVASTVLDPDGREALSEMANIVASTFLSRLASLGRLRLIPSVPDVKESATLHPGTTVAAEYEVVFAEGRASFRLHATPEGSFRAALQSALAAAT
jgi:CheY-specific phosphatase CheX